MLRKVCAFSVLVSAVIGGLPASADGGFVPSQKACVGNPPRQTIDPLSPPCVPFYDGENGGSTARGVTGNEIRIVLYNDLGFEGDMNAVYSPDDERTGVSTGQYQYENLVRTVKAQVKYHLQRYQTYGRIVHIMAMPSTNGPDSSCAEREGDAVMTLAEHRPFAVAILGGQTDCYQRKLAELGVVSFSVGQDGPRSLYRDGAGLIWSFVPDQSTVAGLSAGFICRSLAGRPARLSPDATLEDLPRRFGLIAPTASFRGPALERAAKGLQRALKARCGLDVLIEPYLASSRTAPSGLREAPVIMAKFKLTDVTTVICYCLPVSPELTVTAMQQAATSLGYKPEWYWDSASSMDRVQWQRLFASRDHVSIGSSYLWRQPSFHSTYAYRAFAEIEPGVTPNARSNFDIYHLMLNLFNAVQAAGPNLNKETVQQGMFTLQATNTSNPFTPTGGYGDYGPGAVSPYTFIDTAMGWWYDPSGTEPGGAQGDGCIRPMNGGVRYFASTWPTDDDGLFRASSPCSGPTWKFYDV